MTAIPESLSNVESTLTLGLGSFHLDSTHEFHPEVDAPRHQTTSIGELFDQLFARSHEGIRFAVNQCYVSPDRILVDGDEVAFLPPLGGG